MDAIGITNLAEVAVERRSTILPPPLRSEVAELDLELLAAYARTDAMLDAELDGALGFAATTTSSDTDLTPISEAVPTTLIPPAPPPALGLWFIPVV
jgi:hypothetical protein